MRTSILLPIGLMICLFIFSSCTKDTDNPPVPPPVEAMYFPPVSGNEWQTKSPVALGWDTTVLNDLYNFLDQRNTKAFIILQNGKLVVEKYFDQFTTDSIWYWASAGKTVTAMLVGIAQQEGIVQINQPTSQYLGVGWTTTPANKEIGIQVKHQLTMTTGLNDAVVDPDCTLPECLTYTADAGTRWAYHNAAYTLLDKVIENASGLTFNQYFQQKIRNRIGMNGVWIKTPNSNNVYFSNARSMARFGLLLLNRGKWNTENILNDSVYFSQMINTSQSLNPGYGYLTWLNGKPNYMLPGLRWIFSGSIIPEAPGDMYAALGKNDQKLYVVPSKNLVIIRMGESAGAVHFALSDFDNELWTRLNRMIP